MIFEMTLIIKPIRQRTAEENYYRKGGIHGFNQKNIRNHTCL
jgi:hypothetical protein